jgi:hypothetical protein
MQIRTRLNAPDEDFDETEMRELLGDFMRAVNAREEPPGMQEVISAALTVIGRAVQSLACRHCREIQLEALREDVKNLAAFIGEGEGDDMEKHIH